MSNRVLTVCECGKKFTTYRSQLGKRCSKDCRPKKRKPFYSAKRRAAMHRGDEIDHLTVFESAGWVCWVCKGPVDKNLRLPNLMAATLEHIVPLAKGGTHTWDNVSLSHARCNFERGCEV